MRTLPLTLALLTASAVVPVEAQSSPHPQVLFYGDSITRRYGPWLPRHMPGKNYAVKGVNGITTRGMLRNLPADLQEYKPSLIVLLGGANDLEGVDGNVSLKQIEQNLDAMVKMAQGQRVQVVLSLLTPIHLATAPRYTEQARELNKWIASYCGEHGLICIDYFSAMADAAGDPQPGLTDDGEHPSAKGLAIMAPLAQAAIDAALARKR